MDTERRRILRALGGAVASGALAACAPLQPRERLSFVLVHGAWHGAWCWEKLVPLLREQGHDVSTVELQGHGATRLPVEQINFGGYTKRVTDALDAQGGRTVLVGHSSGCLAASQAAEERAEKIRTLVFLSGFVAANGEAHRALVGADPGQKVSPVLLVDFRPGTKIRCRRGSTPRSRMRSSSRSTTIAVKPMRARPFHAWCRSPPPLPGSRCA